MTNNSFIDDIQLIEGKLKDIEEYSKSSEMLFESYDYVYKLKEEFKRLIMDDNTREDIYMEVYNKMTEAYISMELLFSSLNKNMRVINNERKRIRKVSNLLLNINSPISKYILLGETSEIISSEYISVINRLRKESTTIGFFLDIEEREILNYVESYLNDM